MQTTHAHGATPRAGETSDNAPPGHFQSVSTQAKLSGWPTPTSSLADKGVRTSEGALREAERNHGPDLAAVVALAGWPPPIANMFEVRDMDRLLERRAELAETQGNNGFGLTTGQAAHLAGWATPTANEKVRSPEFQAGRELNAREALSGWATVATRDYRFANLKPLSERGGGKKGEQLPNQVKLLVDYDGPARITADGVLLTGLDAEMPSGGQLNTEFTRWLMGFPNEWGECAREASEAMATR